MITRVYDYLRNGFEMLLDFWAYKMLVSMITAILCFLFGGSEIVLLVVMAFVVLDTLTKWAAITKQYLIDHGVLPEQITAIGMICGFLNAWQPGYLTSTALKQCWAEKIFTYGILIVFAGLTGKLPEIVIAGTQINKAISGGIYAYIAMTELFSMMENLQDMGNKNLATLKQYLGTIVTKITGSNFSVTLSNKDKGGQA